MGVEKRVIHTGRYALPLLILAVGAAALWPVRHALTAETIAALSPRQTFLAASFLVGLYALKSLSVCFPMSALTAAGGLLFPFPLALAVNLCGTGAAQTIPFLLGRRERGGLEALAARFPRVADLCRAQAENRWLAVFLLRLAGAAPGDVVSLYLGASGTPCGVYLSAGLLGGLPRITCATALGGALWQPGSPRFWISLAALPVGLLALSVPLERPHTGMDWKQYARDSRSIIFHSAAIGLFGLTFLCFCILYGPTITYFPLLADLLYKASPSHIGAVFTVASLGTAAIAMNLAWLGRKYSHRRLMLSATCCYVVAQTLMLVLPDAVSSLWWLTLPIFIGGVAQGLTFPLLNARMTTLAPTRNRAIVMAMNGTVLRLSQSLSPLFFGIGWAYIGWRGPYAMGIGVALVIGALVWRVYPVSSGKE